MLPAGVEANCDIAEWHDNYVEAWSHGQCQEKSHDLLGSQFEGTCWDKVYMHYPYNGATFGCGAGPFNMTLVFAAIAARRTQRPVKLVHDSGLFLRYGEAQGTYRYKVGYKNDGTITALELKTVYCVKLNDHTNKMEKGTKIPNIHLTDTKVYTNGAPYSCFKHGKGQCSVMNMVFGHVAAELKIDPTELALINDGCNTHDMTWVNENVKAVQGFDPTRDSLKEVLVIGKAAIDWDNKYHAPGTKILPNGNYHGIGFIWMITWADSPGRNTNCGMAFRLDGTVNVIGTRQLIGTNAEGVNAAVVADELGVKYEDIGFLRENQVHTLSSAGGSGQTSTNTTNLVRCARKLKKILLEYAVKQPGRGEIAFPDKASDELDVRNGEVFEKANPENKKTIKEVIRPFFNYSGFEGTYGSPFYAWDFSPGNSGVTEHMYHMGRQVYFHEVEVDPDTGQVYITKVVEVYDAGKVLDPVGIEGQQYGGLYMGAGRSNTEQIIYDPETGVTLNENLISYPVYLMGDIGSIECHTIETGLSYGPYGMFGCSEAPNACTGTATNAAIYNAIGKWVDSFPTTPNKVLKALGKA